MLNKDFTKFSSLLKDNNAGYDSENGKFVITCADDSAFIKLQNELKEDFSIDSERYHSNQLKFSNHFKDVIIYWGVEDFRERYFPRQTSNLEDFFKKNFAIIEPTDSLIKTYFFEQETNIVYIDNEETSNFYLFSNAQAYCEFIYFLKSNEHTEDGYFHFVDHFDWIREEVILISASKEGKLSVKFTTNIPTFLDEHIDYSKRFENFRKCFDTSDKTDKLPKFVKAQIFNQISGKPKNSRLEIMINSLDEIIEIAQQNFDIYLSDISMMNLKRHYIEAKDKYFTQIREILGKITASVIALPISVSAVALASYTIPAGQNKTPILIALIIAFVVYAVLGLFFLKMYSDDLEDTQEQIRYEFANLEDDPFFLSYKKEKENFDKIKLKLNNKIGNLTKIILAYTLVIIATNCILLYKLLSDVWDSNLVPVICFLFSLCLLGLFTLINREGLLRNLRSNQ